MTQGSLTLYKLILLYMLNRVKFSLTYSQISKFILEKEYTNFLTLQQVISELQEAKLIQAETLTNRTYFSITEEGRDTLSYFKTRISREIIKDIDTYIDAHHMELKSESSITARYYKLSSGEYEAELIAHENNEELVNIKLAIPTEDMAETVCSSWYSKNQKIYKFLMEELF